MNKNQLVIVTLLATVMTLSACNGGNGSQRILGRQCPANYDPVSMNVPENKKGSLESALPPGTYDYNGATLYYKDISNFRMELNDTKQKDNSYKGAVGCMRNDSPNTIGLYLATEGISKMVVESDSSKVTSDVKSYSFRITDSKVVMDFVKSDRKPERPGDLYKGTASESFFYQVDDKNFEIRSHGKTQNGSEYFLAVRFVKK